MKYLILISCLSLTLFSCNTKSKKEITTDYDKICNYFDSTFDFKINENYNKLIVISDTGCSNCNKNFMKFCLNYLNNESSIILITAHSTLMDLSEAMASEGNIFFDSDINTSQFNTFSSSRVIYFDNNAIDTVIVLDSFEIETQFDYIYNREGCQITDE